MRRMIEIRDDLVPTLVELAFRERRSPIKQAEWLLEKALEQHRALALYEARPPSAFPETDDPDPDPEEAP